MIGVFVQLNEASRKGHLSPVGYVIQENGCWDWVGAKSGRYGTIYRSGKNLWAHRYVFEMIRGSTGSVGLDHLCRNPSCVNPDHLEPVSQRINILRGDSPPARQARRTHCLRGHPLSRENVWMAGKNRTKRQCRLCAKIRQRARYHRIKQGNESRA